jgi:hypothetical protein
MQPNPHCSPLLLALFASQLAAQRARCRTENQADDDDEDLPLLRAWEADCAANEYYYATPND